MQKDVIDIKDRVLMNGGFATFQMKDLRIAFGLNSLKIHERQEISDGITRTLGLCYQGEIPNSQSKYLRIYVAGSDYEKLLESVQSPSPEGDRVVAEALSRKVELISGAGKPAFAVQGRRSSRARKRR